MASTVKTSFNNAATSLTITINSLASANYATSNAFQVSNSNPLDVIVECAFAVGTVAGNKQVVVFVIGSSDGTNYDIANSSTIDTTHDTMMAVLGVVNCPNNSETVRRRFSLAAAYGGTPPPYVKLVVKNDTGAVLSGSGNAINTTEVWGVVA